MKNGYIKNAILLITRIWISCFFLDSGINKVQLYTNTALNMSKSGIDPSFLPLVILLEIGGGLAIMLGFLTRFTSICLFVYILLCNLLLSVGGSLGQLLMYAEISWAGAYLLLIVTGPGKFSLDHLLKKYTHKLDYTTWKFI